MKVQSIYNSKILKKGLEFAAENGSLFVASASLAFSTARPMLILATPYTDKENKQYASTKAIASTVIGYLMMLITSVPVADAVKNINENPAKYLKQETIKFLQGNEKSLKTSKKYSFVTQLFKLGLGVVVAAPKSILTCALIPPIMYKLFKKKAANTECKEAVPSNKPKFTGNIATNKLAVMLGKIADSTTIKNLTERFHNTKFEQHIISFTDIFSTGTFISLTASSKKIKEDRKKALIYNSVISTGLSVAGMYAIDSLTQKPTEKFIEKFKQVNINSPKLNTYLEGIRIAKPTLILGSIYYILIPLLSTFAADRFVKHNRRA